MNFFHTFLPNPILFELGPITIYWYGFFMALAILGGFLITLKIATWHGVKKETIYDLFFYLIIGGFIGARIFYILYNPIYFWNHPLDIFKIWQGGIAIHGALFFGIVVLWWFVYNISPKPPLLIRRGERAKRGGEVFWKLSAIIAPGVALGQMIGRWGNYFNQELFGQPTNLLWGIPIELANRSAGFEMFTHFQPTFLYESIGSLVIFLLLILGHRLIIKKGITTYGLQLITLSYLLFYSILRFMIEFFRIDPTAGNIGGMRATQLISLLTIVAIFLFLVLNSNKRKRSLDF